MKYEGKLYAKINGEYVDTGKTSDDWDRLEEEAGQEGIVKQLLNNDSNIDELLEEIDDKAKEESFYEYGLPLYSEASKDRFRKLIIQWVSNLNS